MGSITPIMPNYNLAMARRPDTNVALRAFNGVGQMRERDGDGEWFPVEFLFYYDDQSKLRNFSYARREDGREIPDGHYFFLDDLGERTHKWRKWMGNWQVGWRYRRGV